jgi:hypothetical protein
VSPNRSGLAERRFYEPTIATDVSDRVALSTRNSSALPIVEYTDIDAAVRRANSGMFGLGGSVWSAEAEQAATVAQRLGTGLSWVTTHTVLSPALPFCGAQWGGLGTEAWTRHTASEPANLPAGLVVLVHFLDNPVDHDRQQAGATPSNSPIRGSFPAASPFIGTVTVASLPSGLVDRITRTV